MSLLTEARAGPRLHPPHPLWTLLSAFHSRSTAKHALQCIAIVHVQLSYPEHLCVLINLFLHRNVQAFAGIWENDQIK